MLESFSGQDNDLLGAGEGCWSWGLLLRRRRQARHWAKPRRGGSKGGVLKSHCDLPSKEGATPDKLEVILR